MAELPDRQQQECNPLGLDRHAGSTIAGEGRIQHAEQSLCCEDCDGLAMPVCMQCKTQVCMHLAGSSYLISKHVHADNDDLQRQYAYTADTLVPSKQDQGNLTPKVPTMKV